MGLILGPLIIFWFLMGVYSLKIGYTLFNTLPSLQFTLVVYFIALLFLALYVHIGFKSFKTQKELWWCRIPLSFAFNKIPCGIFIIAILMHWFGSNYLTQDYLKPIPFIAIFSVSFGAIIGVFASDSFMNKHQIKRTY